MKQRGNPLEVLISISLEKFANVDTSVRIIKLNIEELINKFNMKSMPFPKTVDRRWNTTWPVC